MWINEIPLFSPKTRRKHKKSVSSLFCWGAVALLSACGQTDVKQTPPNRSEPSKIVQSDTKVHLDSDCPITFDKGKFTWVENPSISLFDLNGNRQSFKDEELVALSNVIEDLEKYTGLEFNYGGNNTSALNNQGINIVFYCSSGLNPKVKTCLNFAGNPSITKDGFLEKYPRRLGFRPLYRVNDSISPVINGVKRNRFEELGKLPKDYLRIRIPDRNPYNSLRFIKNVDGAIFINNREEIIGTICYINNYYHTFEVRVRLLSECLLRSLGIYGVNEKSNLLSSQMKTGEAIYDHIMRLSEIETNCLTLLYKG